VDFIFPHGKCVTGETHIPLEEALTLPGLAKNYVWVSGYWNGRSALMLSWTTLRHPQ